ARFQQSRREDGPRAGDDDPGHRGAVFPRRGRRRERGRPARSGEAALGDGSLWTRSRGAEMKFHSHVYFDHEEARAVAAARAYRERIRRTFAATSQVEVHSFLPGPAGPHTRGSFEVQFTREVFADYVSWLMFTRPEGIDILVHPLTGSQVLDHTSRALWLGRPVVLDEAMLEAVDAKR